MKNKQNLHTHTTYADGKDGPEELVLEAVKRGFDSIGFSEHSYNSWSSYRHQMTAEDAEAYKNEVAELKVRYKGQIDVFCGLELEFCSQVPTDGYDYVIGSVHYLDFDGEQRGFDRDLEQTLAFIRDNFAGDGLAFAKKYFETVAELPRRKNVDIVGHFDLLVKNNDGGKFLDTGSREYLDAGFAAIHALKGKIPLFEINTGPIPRGYRSVPYPQTEFLREFQRCGFGVVMTSDCHDKHYLDAGFPEAEALLRSTGFRTKWILTDDGFKEVAL